MAASPPSNALPASPSDWESNASDRTRQQPTHRRTSPRHPLLVTLILSTLIVVGAVFLLAYSLFLRSEDGSSTQNNPTSPATNSSPAAWRHAWFGTLSQTRPERDAVRVEIDNAGTSAVECFYATQGGALVEQARSALQVIEASPEKVVLASFPEVGEPQFFVTLTQSGGGFYYEWFGSRERMQAGTPQFAGRLTPAPVGSGQECGKG